MIKTLLKILFASLASSGIANQSCAAESSPEFVSCMDKATDNGALITTERIKCLKSELKLREGLLYKDFQAKLALASPKQKRLLSHSQEQWVSYRNAWCLVEKSSPIAPGYELNELFCFIDLTSDRATKLNELILK